MKSIKRIIKQGVGRLGPLVTLFSGNNGTTIFSDRDRHIYFGYYDLDPVDRGGKKLLAMAVSAEGGQSAGIPAEIGYFEVDNPRIFRPVGISKAWCWQQGARLQWFPNKSDDLIFYNTVHQGKYSGVIQESSSKNIVFFLPRPLYAISSDGRWGLSINFARLQRLRRGYGYSNLRDLTEGVDKPHDDGIWRVDLNSKEEKLLFSIKDISEGSRQSESAEHYFNHIMFNPDGSRFMFYHIWKYPDGKRKMRLLTADINGKNIYILNDSGHTSHCNWVSNSEIIMYGTCDDQGMNYYLCRDMSDHRQIVGKGILKNDGHPSFINSRWMITDTYPDVFRNQHLILFDAKNNKRVIIKKLHSPLHFSGEVRCDLHPRPSLTGRHVCIDFVHNNKRAMMMIDVSRFIHH